MTNEGVEEVEKGLLDERVGEGESSGATSAGSGRGATARRVQRVLRVSAVRERKGERLAAAKGDGTRKRRRKRRWSSWYRPAEKGVDFSTPGRRTSVRGTCSGLDYD